MTLDGVMSISRFKNLRNTCKASVTVKILGRIFSHIMVENWQHLKDTLAFSLFLVCWNQNRVLLTSDLLPSISLVVSQSSVNISLALHAHEICTSRLTSNQ